MRIDAHQHFWRFEQAEFPWIQRDWPICRDFFPRDLAPHLERHGFDGCIAVQARQTAAESQWLLELADREATMRGVVGWVDLRASDVEQQLETLARHPRFKGVRHLVQDEPDDRFLLRSDFLRGVQLLPKYDLSYDLLVYPRQLPAAVEFARQLPMHRLVLDHIAKPPIAAAQLEPWASDIRSLAALPNVACKVSGLITEADWRGWSADDFLPFFEVILEAFGPERLMYGSDWPVCTLAGSYDDVVSLAQRLFACLSAAEQALVFGENAGRWYRLGASP